MAEGETTRQQFLALFSAVMLPMFMAAVDQTLLATATPVIAREMGALSDTSWVVIGYLLAATIIAPVYGRAGDRLGRRQMLLVALAVFCAGSLACGLAGSMTLLIGARALQGLGGGGLMVLSQALIGELVRPRDRPRYQAYFAIVFTASSVGGPVLGGLVVQHASWRWLFLVNVPLCMLAAWRVTRLPRAPASALRDAPLDPLGFLTFALAGGATLLWFSLAGHRFGVLSPESAGLVAVAVVSSATMWRHQSRHADPFLPWDILRTPGARPVCATVLCFAAAMFALVFLLPIYLQLGHGANAASAGLQLLPLTGGLVLGSWVNGRYTARAGAVGRTPVVGLGLAASALALLALSPPSPHGTAVASAACGLGFGTVMPTAQLTLQLLAGRERLGAAAALLSLTRSAGGALGTAGFGGLAFALLDVGPGRQGAPMPGIAPGELLQSFRIVFAVLAVFLGAGALAASRIPTTSLEEREETPVPAP